jgi:leucyl-tRNA synthetase
VTTDMLDFHFNTMVAALIEFSNGLSDMKTPELMGTSEWRNALRTMVLMMAPSTPYVSEELWEKLGGAYSVHTQTWPTFDEELAKDDFVELVIQVNGKVRDRVTLPADAAEESAKEAARRTEKIAAALDGVQVVREIYVPGRLMNFVVKPK